jgi:hypothetical protein
MSGKADKARPPRHWVKRPPRPSRPAAPPPRVKPGATQAVIAAAVGLVAAVMGAALGVSLQAPEGARGAIAGLFLCLGAILTWKRFGGTRQDFRDLFR